MSTYRNRVVPACKKCGSDLAGRFSKTVDGTRQGKAVKVDVFRCRCGGGRRIARHPEGGSLV